MVLAIYLYRGIMIPAIFSNFFLIVPNMKFIIFTAERRVMWFHVSIK